MTERLEVVDVAVQYGRGARAVEGATLSVDRGECAVVLGPNGAGKTSLIRAVSGFLSHERVTVTGRVSLDGKRIDGHAVDRRARARLAYIPERDKVFRELTIAENIHVFASRRPSKDGLADDLAFVNDLFPSLENLPKDRPAGLLSGGEQQMLAITCALVTDPISLLVDEPSLGLAPILVSGMMRALGRVVAEKDIALLLVDQNVRSTRHIATKVYSMTAGQVTLESGDDLFERLARDGYAKAVIA